ncbi:uncharacterized protein LOC124940241 isoform X2 [Impatiens glandulifera]|uniref:uncharacterized protein LOC124940241 isoform X2 n=1 Tax=Impatiens glandulifera TaxID=253017 RepID=UPI001FB12C9F|nr:uncharacterized protein LOC124940241 isoform X2 [Impatiens glandulifera]
MGRPPSNGGPSFRFNAAEVAEMEAILHEHKNQMPTREALTDIAEKFSTTAERSGKFVVQMKQVWNWFQNRRYAIRAKGVRVPGLLNAAPMPRQDPTVVRSIPQPPPTVVPPSTVLKSVSDSSHMEFEAKSARDGAWYDVAMFISHRSVETGDPDVLIRFSGFGVEEDEWVNVRKHVRQRSLPCESSECVSVLPGDLILCFQEGKEQALYYDAHVLDSQRRRHDVRGCRCRFLVRYDHDLSEEIVPLRKVCRRPETDYRLQQLHGRNDLGPGQQLKSSTSNAGNHEKLHVPTEVLHKHPVQAVAVMPSLSPQGTVIESITVSPADGNMGISIVTSSSNATAMASDNQVIVPPPANATAIASDIQVTVPPPANADNATVVASDIQVTVPQPANAAAVANDSEVTVPPPDIAVAALASDIQVVLEADNADISVMENDNEVNVLETDNAANFAAMEIDNEVTVLPPDNAANGTAVMESDNEVNVLEVDNAANFAVMESDNVTVLPPDNAANDTAVMDNEVNVVLAEDNAGKVAVIESDNYEVNVVLAEDNAGNVAVMESDNEVNAVLAADNAGDVSVMENDNEVNVVLAADNAGNVAVMESDNDVTVLPPDNASHGTAVMESDNEVNVLPPDNAANGTDVMESDNGVNVELAADNSGNVAVMESDNEVNVELAAHNSGNVAVMESDNEVTVLPSDNATKVAVMESDNEVTGLAEGNAGNIVVMESDNEVTVGPPANDTSNGTSVAVPPSASASESAVGSDNEVKIPSPPATATVEIIAGPKNGTPTDVEVLNDDAAATSGGPFIVQSVNDIFDVPIGTPLIVQPAANDVPNADAIGVASVAPAEPANDDVPETSIAAGIVENFSTDNADGVTTPGAQAENNISPEISTVVLVETSVVVDMNETPGN